MTTVLGIVIVVLAAGLILGLTFIRHKSPPTFRNIPAFDRLKRSIGVSVEDGTRLHISLGRGALQTPQSAPGLAGLAMLRHLTEQTSVSDKPPIVTSGDGALSILSRDTLQAAYRAAGAEDIYRDSTGRLTGLTPFSFAAGAIPTMRDEDVSANLLIGHFGSEVALLTDTAERTNTIAVAATDGPSAQAVLYATTDEPLIGEELFAAGAYTGADIPHQASLQTQDILRWLIIVALLGGSLFKLAGVL